MNVKTATIAAAIAILSFISGIFTSDFVNYRSDNRTRIKGEIEAYTDITKQLDAVLSDFAAIASGERPVKDDDLAKLRTGLLDLQRSARGVISSLPEMAPKYEKLDSAIVSVLSASSKISTADRNKPFVTAVIALVEEADEFQQVARDRQAGYLTGLRL